MRPILSVGTPIAVVAPCGVHDPARLERGMEIVRSHGHDLRPFPNLLNPHRYLASPDAQRREQLVEALTSPEYGAVWIARGGYGLTRILDALPEKLTPKPVIGFSDVTALFAALRRIPGHGPSIHGPVLHSLPITDADSIAWLFDRLAGSPVPPLQGEPWIPGNAEGPIVGGNLALLAALCGTPHQVDVRGCLVLLEDIGERPYRLDRMITQLIAAGGLRGAKGVVLGEFVDCDPPRDSAWTLREVLIECLQPLGVPVLAGIPVGHGARNRAFAWDEPARIQDGRLVLSPGS